MKKIINAVDFNSFPELLIERSKLHGEKTALITLDDAGEEVSHINYKDLVKRISFYASKLHSKLKKGDRCIVLLPPGIDFVVAYLSCLFAGVIAVPSNIPRRNKANSRFWAVMKDAAPGALMLDENTQNLINKYFAEQEEIKDVMQIRVEDKKSDKIFQADAAPSDIAYLQYTSGSTGHPKGVMVSHENLLKNSEVISRSFRHTEDLIVMNWLPPFHDMGLVGNLLQPLYMGGISVIMNPGAFLKSPMVWLKAIGKYKATTTGCPNFALDYCVEKINEEQKKQIDLSSIGVFYCGSEPIRKESFTNFSEAFADCGFEEKKLLPCYGLAESTLMVTGIDAEETPVYLQIDKTVFENQNKVEISTDNKNSINLVSCGHPWKDNEVMIVDPKTSKQLPEGEIGEILVSGSSVAKGYFRDEKETKKTFMVYAAGTVKGPFMRTGDMGFLYKGHLYVSGRRKDLIIIRGINHYPQQIEHTVENCHEALQGNGCAAFSVEAEGTEQLVVVQEVQRIFVRNFNKEEITQAIRLAIAEEHEISVYAIELISPGSLPKTTSGKIKRAACRMQWSNKELRTLASWQQEATSSLPNKKHDFSIDDFTKWLVLWLSSKTGIRPEDIDLNKPVLSYGLDSISAVELERELHREFGISISLVDMLANKSIRELISSGEKDLRGK